MTSIESGPTWSERLDPRNWTLVWKLVVVGLVPALLALVLGVLRVSDQASEAADLGRSSRLLEVQQRVAGAADALRQERDEATLFVAGNRVGDRGVLEIGFGQADGELDEMLSAVRGASELDPTTSSALQQTEGGLAQLPPLRTDAIENATIGASQVRTRYDDVVEGVDVLDRALLRQLRTPGVAGLADALTAVTSADEQLAVQHTVLGAAIRANRLLPGDATDVAATDNQVASDFRQYQVALTPEQLGRFGNFLDDAANAQRERLKAAILATPADRPIAIAPNEWDTAYNGSRAAANRSADLLRNELVAMSVSAEEQASNLAGVNSVILMLGLLLGIAVTVLIARALLRSLRVLRTSALDVAERRLPLAVESMRAGEVPDVTVDPVPLSSRDEVGQVARAFDAVHGQAIRLAADQAALQSNVSSMFVNLSRRSQALVERQLQLIEQLESNEQDPDQLSNLFQLDHLATRMRRNSENLLVLAGTDLAKRNIAPVPMVDVLRAAVSEIEQYQRIVVQTPPTTKIVGRAASDLVHLLAELLDNATNFSPPDSQVVMSTARTADGSIVIEIADRGVGMADHELSDANQRLSGPSTVDVSASRRMGLFVVGRLGARHGVGVRLLTSSAGGPGAGLTASVTVPAHLVPSMEPADANRPIGVPQRAGAAAQGGRLGTPPQRGVNGTPRAGGLSALIAGTDGPANPTSVFDAPAGKDSQLFTPPPSANGAQSGTLSGPQSGLPSRRPGSTLRPGGPPQPPDLRGQEPGAPDPADRSADEQAREVAAQARRDQETAAARARGERVDEQQAPSRNGVQPEQQRNGVRPDTAPKEEQPPKPAGSTPATGGPVTNGKALGTGTPASGEARSEGGTPGRREGPSGSAPAEEPAAGAAKATPARPEQGATEQTRTGARSQPDRSQPDQAQPDQARPEQDRADQARTEQARTENRTDTRAQQKRPDQAGSDNDGTEDTRADKGRADATRADAPGPSRPSPSRSVRLLPSRPARSSRGRRGSPAPARPASRAPGRAPSRPAPTRPGPHPRPPRRAFCPCAGRNRPSRCRRRRCRCRWCPGTRPPSRSPRGSSRRTPLRGPSSRDSRRSVPSSRAVPPSSASGRRPSSRRPCSSPPHRSRGPAASPPRRSPRPSSRQPSSSLRHRSRRSSSRPLRSRSSPPAGPAGPAGPASRSSRQPAQQPTAQQPVQQPAAPRPVQPAQPAQPAASRPGEPSAPQDGLFAPSVPVIAEPGARGLGESRQAEAFDLGETTPIFEEIASAWFRSNRPLPVDWQAEQGGEPEAPKVAPRPSPRPVPRPKPSPAPAPEAVAPAATPSAADQSFASLADEGWAAASGVVAERPDELTAAGLPKRRPRARLVPGSAGSAVLAPPAAATRSAENIRGRLASYQQGVRQGRESKLRGEQGAAPGANGGTEPPATAGGNHDEESS